MRTIQKMCIGLSVLAAIGCGKHQLPAKSSSSAATDTGIATVNKSNTPVDNTANTQVESMIIGGETKFGSKAFQILTTSPTFDDTTIDHLLELASDKFKIDFDGENFLSIMAHVGQGKVQLSKSFMNLYTGVDEIAKKGGKIFMTTPTNDQTTEMLASIKVGKTQVKLTSGGAVRGVEPETPEMSIEPLDDGSYPVEMILDGRLLKRNLPIFTVASVDEAKLDPLTFDLSQADKGYGVNIQIEKVFFKIEEPVECMIMHVATDKTNKDDINFAMTSFAKFKDNEFNFSNLELDKMKKLPKDKNIPVYFACFMLVLPEDDKNNGVLLTYTGLNIKVIESASPPATSKDNN